MRGVTRLERCLYIRDFDTREQPLSNECEVHYLLSGKRGMYIENETIVMEAGSLLFINRQVEHKSITISDDQYEYFIMCYHPEVSAQWQHIVPDIDFSRLYKRSYMLLEPYMMDQVFIQGMVKTLLNSWGAGMRGVFNLKMLELLVYLVIKSKDANINSVLKMKGVKKKHYLALTQYIADCNYNVTLDDLCQRFFLSRYYICHLFKEEGGLTIRDFITENKIKCAVNYLENTDLAITEIVEKCDYSSISSFGRIFKDQMGVSPREYRKRHRIHLKSNGG